MKKNTDLKVGDIVFVKDDDPQPRSKWPLGKVNEQFDSSIYKERSCVHYNTSYPIACPTRDTGHRFDTSSLTVNEKPVLRKLSSQRQLSFQRQL